MSNELRFDARRAVRAVPAVALLAVLAILPVQAWARAARTEVTVAGATPAIESTTWAGRVAADGTVAVSVSYRFGDTRERLLDVRAPANSAFVELDGRPLALDNGRYADDLPVRDTATVSYTRRGAVTRHADGVVVDLTDHAINGGAMLECIPCHIDDVQYGNAALFAALFAEHAEQGRWAVAGVGAWRTGSDTRAGTGALRFAAEHGGVGTVALVAWLPVEAAPDAPLADGTAEDRYQSIRAALAADGTPTKEPSPTVPVGRGLGALILTAMVGGLAAWIGWRVVRARRQLARDLAELDPPPPQDAAFAPPGDLEPALVTHLVGLAGPGRRSAVAAALLMLAHRGAIGIDGIDSRRFRLELRPGTRGSTRFEEAVLAELRPQGSMHAAATLTGPPVWGPGGRQSAKKLAVIAYREARRQGLHRLTLGPAVLVPATLLIGATAAIVSGGTSTLAWVVLVVGPLVALAAAGLTGVTLTARGRLERQRWMRYGEWLRANSELERVGAPAVATWGEILAYAAALGAAPVAAADLSPNR